MRVLDVLVHKTTFWELSKWIRGVSTSVRLAGFALFFEGLRPGSVLKTEKAGVYYQKSELYRQNSVE